MNTYSGGTNLNGGILAVNSDVNLGTGALSFNGGTLQALVAGGGIDSSKAVDLAVGGGTFLADAGAYPVWLIEQQHHKCQTRCERECALHRVWRLLYASIRIGWLIGFPIEKSNVVPSFALPMPIPLMPVALREINAVP